MIKGVFAVALRSPWSFESEVRRNRNGKELVGPVHDEGFSAFGKIWIEHPSVGKAVRNVVHNVGGDPDAKSGTILRLMDFA